MIPTSLPFDYAKLLDHGDRVRTPRGRTTGRVVRRTKSRGDA